MLKVMADIISDSFIKLGISYEVMHSVVYSTYWTFSSRPYTGYLHTGHAIHSAEILRVISTRTAAGVRGKPKPPPQTIWPHPASPF